jgi:hypothetical protein
MDVISCNDLVRLGEKKERIPDDFGGVGGLGLYGEVPRMVVPWDVMGSYRGRYLIFIINGWDA